MIWSRWHHAKDMIDEPTNAPINDHDNQPATKGDIYQSEKRIHVVLTDFKKELLLDNQKFRKEILADNKKTRQHFDVVAENIHKDVADANLDEITLIKNQQIPNLDTRTQALEKTTGLPVGSVSAKV